MGIPLAQSKQTYMYMSPPLRYFAIKFISQFILNITLGNSCVNS